MNINLVESLFCYTFAPDKSHLDRLVAHCRVFFDKRSGKAERIEQFIAECRIEYGLQFVARPKGTLARQEPSFSSIPQTAFI